MLRVVNIDPDAYCAGCGREFDPEEQVALVVDPESDQFVLVCSPPMGCALTITASQQDQQQLTL